MVDSGDPGFLFIRDLNFVRFFPGFGLESKLRYAIRFLLREMDLRRMIDDTLGYEIKFHPFIKPSEYSDQMINLLAASPQEKPPSIVLKELPSEYHSMVNLQPFFLTLATLRNIDIDGNDVFLQFEDAQECSKALTKLCSSSLKTIMNNESRMVDYDLNLKDLSDSNIFQEIFTNNSASLKKDSNKTVKGQDNMHALMIRMTQLEEELKYLKAKMEASPVGLSY